MSEVPLYLTLPPGTPHSVGSKAEAYLRVLGGAFSCGRDTPVGSAYFFFATRCD